MMVMVLWEWKYDFGMSGSSMRCVRAGAHVRRETGICSRGWGRRQWVGPEREGCAVMLRGEEGGRVKGGAAVERVRDAMRMSTERRGSIVGFLVER